MQNTLQEQVAQRIYELLPHKKELEFGCEWKLNNDIWTYANGFSFIKNNKNSWSGVLPEKDVIIGQPLRLADLLLAISKLNGDIIRITEFGEVRQRYLGEDKDRRVSNYNLSQDNLLDQSDEFCEFVYNLIK